MSAEDVNFLVVILYEKLLWRSDLCERSARRQKLSSDIVKEPQGRSGASDGNVDIYDQTNVNAIWRRFAQCWTAHWSYNSGAFYSLRRTISSAAIKTLLDVPSLAVEIKATAISTTYRYSCVGQWKSCSIHRELKRQYPVGLWNALHVSIKIHLLKDAHIEVWQGVGGWLWSEQLQQHIPGECSCNQRMCEHIFSVEYHRLLNR